MFSSNVMGGGKKQRPSAGFLVRPRLGTLRSVYSNRPFSYSPEKRKKSRKSTTPKMEWRRKPDYADTAYRDAVGRLRILLAESYAPIKRPLRELDSAGEETDNQSVVSAASKNSKISRSYYHYNPITPRKYYYYPSSRKTYNALSTETQKPLPEPPNLENQTRPPELMSFIERQDEYIEQLEKESKVCREELSSVLVKVKDLIKENEHLHDRQMSRKIKSVFENLDTETDTETDAENKSILKSPKKSRKSFLLEGPAIVFESRISELEAQLTQARIDLKKAVEENETNRRKLNDGTILESAGYESYKKQLDNLQREKLTLQDTVQKLQNTIALLREKENDTADKVKRSLDVAEQAQYEKNAAESEIRRLKDELERQHMKLRDAIADQGRRIADERSAIERRYTQQIEQLTAELGVQWESSNKLQLELDKQRRENADLRREVAQKQALIDEMKKDMQNKIITLQSDIGVSGAEKGALEQQISMLQMANERSERQGKQEIVRLQAEIQSLRQRIDRADADLIHSRRENIRLSEQVSSLEKEINLTTALSEERNKTPRGSEIVALPPPTPKREDKEKELTSMVYDMENRHAATVAELEGMIHSQNQLMEKLSSECHTLTQKLEDASVRHKEEIRELQTNLKFLSNKFSQSQFPPTNLKDEEHTPTSRQRNESPQSVAFNPKPISSPPQSVEPARPARFSQPIDADSVKPQPAKNEPTKTYAEPEQKLLSRMNSNVSTKLNTSSRQNSQDQFQNVTVPSHLEMQKGETNIANQSSVQHLLGGQANQPGQEHTEDREYPQYDTSEQYNPNQHYDPGQQYDPNPAYDPNQHYDPSQQYGHNEQYDPNQEYDPNQGYDPSQEYDPNQQYDPNLHYDPTKQYDSTLQYESNDPNQPYQVNPDDIQKYNEDVSVPDEHPHVDSDHSTEVVEHN